MKKTKPLKKTFLILLLIFPLAIISKLFQYTFMGKENFIIMDYILSYIPRSDLPLDKSFAFPIQVYRLFSFLPFKTSFEWSMFWAILFSIIIFVLLLKYRKFSIKEYIFIFSSLFIIDLTVLNMNKDLIQFLVLIIIYGIIKSNLKDVKKIIIISVIFLFESLVFRAYYILICGLLIMICYILKYFIGLNQVKKKSVIKALFLILACMFFGIYLMKYVSFSSYQELINRRDILMNESITAATKIVNLLPGEDYINFMINYFINFLRICFPIELLLKGFQYIPFVIYQFFLTINMFKLIRKTQKNNYILIALLIAHWLTFAASESDFGTLVRHQSILLFIYLDMLKINIGDLHEKKD